MNPFGLYVHIPYCRTKCPYCDFNSYAATTWPELRYTDALVSELRHYTDRSIWREMSLDTVFFGGGTPSLFSADSIARLLDGASTCFRLSPDAEITLEANPGTVTLDRLRGLRNAGVTRISFGIQSFQPHVLKTLGRLHTVEETRLAADLAHEAGFEEVNLDLIFAVPGQTLDDLRQDIDRVVSQQPTHVSAYNLTYEEGTAFFEMRESGRIAPVAEELEAAMFLEVRRRLTDAGYHPYEVSNFAMPGHECRHNLNYWKAGAYLGIGAGAHSYEPAGARGLRFANEKDPGRYMDLAIRSGSTRVFEEELDARRSAGEFAFLNLRLSEGFPEKSFVNRFGQGVAEVFPGIASMEENGLIRREGGRLRLTDRGLLLADSVFASFV